MILESSIHTTIIAEDGETASRTLLKEFTSETNPTNEDLNLTFNERCNCSHSPCGCYHSIVDTDTLKLIGKLRYSVEVYRFMSI